MRAPMLRRTDPVEQRYVEHIIDQCREEGIAIRTKPTRTLSKRMKCTAWFDGNAICIARRNKYWFELFLHEFSHLRQKIEKTIWFAPNASRYWATFEDWISGKINPTEDRLLECVRFIQQCEQDCEKRVVALAAEFKFPSIEIDDYIKGANSYVWEYEAARLTRKWGDRRLPYRVPAIKESMPSRFIREDQFGKLPDGYLVNFVRHCVKT